MLDKKNLHAYQKEGAKHILDNTHCALFLDMGLGKTVTTLTAFKTLCFEELDVDNMLIIAPKRVASSVWDAEVENWAHLQGLIVSKIQGTGRQREAALAKKAHIYTLGRDNVTWACGLYGGLTLPFDMLVIDESSSFKNHKSLRFKALKKVAPSFKRVVLLTGTPAPNSLMELWPQLYLLDQGKRLGKFITHFRKEFFTQSYNGFSYDINKGAAEKIHNAIGDICMSMSADDYLELPERRDNFIEVVFPDTLKSKYQEFEREKVLELFSDIGPGAEIPAFNAAALSTKLVQFANGAVYDEDKNVHVVHELKLEALEEIIEDANGRPVLVAWTYQHDRDRILRKFKKLKPRNLKTDQDIKDWNKGKIKLLLMHPASGGHGLNLQKGGDIVVWFGQTWSLELYQQFNARLHRQGQINKVVVHHIISKGTIDERVVNALSGKKKGQDSLLEAVKAYINKYI